MKQLVVAMALFGTALCANAALMLRAERSDMPPEGNARIDLAGKIVEIPRILIRDRAQMGGGRLEKADIAVAIADLSPLPAPSSRNTDRPMPDSLRLILTSSRDQLESVELFGSVYARFLAGETWSNPGGLVMRRFRAGTPYEDRELYLGAGGGRPFVALCPRDVTARAIEPCSTVIRIEGLDVELRFNAQHLPEWRRFLPHAVTMVSEFAAAGRRIPLP